MRRIHSLRLFCIIILLSGMVSLPSAWSAGRSYDTKPGTNSGKPWRIAYYEGGEYIDYQKSLIALVEGFMKLGWIDKKQIPEQAGSQTADLWKWLADEAGSRFLVFAADGHYTANWDKKQQAATVEKIISRLNTQKDIDLIIAAGTKAGQGLANSRHHVPTLVVSTSAPIKAGIIKSVKDSGLDHVHARVDPSRYERQLDVFKDVIHFKKLGVAYENSPEGRTYGAIDKVEKAAKARRFEVVSCYTRSSDTDKKTAENSVLKCFEELAGNGVDAIYVTRQIGVSAASIHALAKIANDSRIPTFSQSGSKEVKAGILFSMSVASFEPVGMFYAETAAKIFNGSKPRDLDQVFEAPPKIAINLKTAEDIGIIDKLPMRLMRTADEIYQEIEAPAK